MGVKREPFEVVVERFGALVLRVCWATVGPSLAEDAWSETFVAALRAYPELPPSANVEAWLVTIARNKAIDQARARARRAVPVEELPETAVHDDPETALDLWAALKRLPEKQRESVAYHYLAGLPYAEVARLTGGSPASARRAGADGIASLRTMLARPAEER